MNIRKHLIRAKVPDNSRHDKRQMEWNVQMWQLKYSLLIHYEDKSVKHKSSQLNINDHLIVIPKILYLL